jgi:tetratricopeptide (TPR) repeat protein
MGALYTNLGIVAEYTGDYAEARRLQEQSLALREEVGDRWNLANAQNNLGNIARLQNDHAEARARLEEALRIQLEVGDLWSIALVRNNLANVIRDQGDLATAAGLYAEALAGYSERIDKWSLTFLFEDLAAFAAATGDAERALMLAGVAEALRAEIGVPRGPSDAEQLERMLAPARAALPDDRQSAAWSTGQALELDAAISEARRACVGEVVRPEVEIPA